MLIRHKFASERRPSAAKIIQSFERGCYPVSMTTVDIVLRYAAPPTEAVTFALANAREVYGIRRLSFDREARTVRVEYDATRLSAAEVMKLVRSAGLQVMEEIQLALPVPAPEPAPAA
jgi:hypothetical protein